MTVIVIDINECQNPKKCSGLYKECLNIPEGSYTCHCMDGYENSTTDKCIGKF